MFKTIKIIRQILAALLLTPMIVIVATGVYCYHYQEQIIQKFLDAANKRLDTPIQISSVQVAVLKSFPKVALILHDVVVKDRIVSAVDLITARKMGFTFDVWKLIQGQYVLDHLYLEYGKIHLGEDSRCQLVWETGVSATTQREMPLMVKLQEIDLRDMEVVYGSKQQRCMLTTDKMQASLRWEHDRLAVGFQGQATIQRIQCKDLSFSHNLPVSLKATLSYDRKHKTWTFQTTRFSHGDARLDIQGSGRLAAASSAAFTIQGKKINPKLLLCCLPKQCYTTTKSYDLHGALTFCISVNKQQQQPMALQGTFTLCDGTLSTSQFSKPVELCQLSGHLHIPNVQDLKTATFSIDKITGMLSKSKLEGNFSFHNFHNLHLRCAAKATLDLTSFSTLLGKTTMTDASGQLDLHWQLETNLQQLLRGIPTKDIFCLSGVLQTQAAQFRLGPSQILCKDFMGNLSLKDNTLVMKNFSGSVGSGLFVLNGNIYNILSCFFPAHQKPCIDAKMYIDHLDLDTLFCDGRVPTVKNGQSPAAFAIAPHWALNLDCDIQQLHCRRFLGKNVRGNVKVKDRKLIVEKLQLSVSGGKVFLDGVLDASTDQLKIHTGAKLQGVHLANLFYTFENFHQNFLMDRHLSGEVFSDFELTMQADRQWNMCWEALRADIDVRLHNGGLHNFEPIQRLAKYAAKESLENLHFSKLKNHILIKDKTIHVPLMEVHSNLTRIQVSGTHTFDGRIDYSFGIPFTGLQKTQATNTPETLTGLYLFFKLQGDIDDYRILHDAEASKKDLKRVVKEQGKMLSAIVKGEYQEKKQLQELAIDDYFEFDE